MAAIKKNLQTRKYDHYCLPPFQNKVITIAVQAAANKNQPKPAI